MSGAQKFYARATWENVSTGSFLYHNRKGSGNSLSAITQSSYSNNNETIENLMLGKTSPGKEV
jgi:hypothetical protein